MRNRSLLMAGLFFLAVSLFSCQPSDSTVQKAVSEKLSSSPGVTADVKDGVVTLNGEVTDEGAKASAEEAVKGVNGVKSVSNNIMVQAPVPPTPPAAMGVDTTTSKLAADSALGGK